jgi:hypothetical protein
MTKTLQEIQEFNRRKIICAVNGTENYEEALEKELTFGCIVIDLKHQFFGVKDPHEMTLVYDTEDGVYYFDHYRGNPFLLIHINKILDKERFQIIGKPLTLDRVLLAIQRSSNWLAFWMNCHGDMIYEKLNKTNKRGKEIKIRWNLTEPTLEKQSEETQRAIYGLLGGGDE